MASNGAHPEGEKIDGGRALIRSLEKEGHQSCSHL